MRAILACTAFIALVSAGPAAAQEQLQNVVVTASRIDIDDLYYITQHPTDINGDGIADAEDARCLERYLRRNELEDMTAGRR